MNTGAIDPDRIKSMLAQLKAAAQKPDAMQGANALGAANPLKSVQETGKVDFAQALKSSLNQVNATQRKAEQLGQNFVLGDDRVSLSDVMIAGQKANIAFQATVQVRNKLVSAYQDIMNMPI